MWHMLAKHRKEKQLCTCQRFQRSASGESTYSQQPTSCQSILNRNTFVLRSSCKYISCDCTNDSTGCIQDVRRRIQSFWKLPRSERGLRNCQLLLSRYLLSAKYSYNSNLSANGIFREVIRISFMYNIDMQMKDKMCENVESRNADCHKFLQWKYSFHFIVFNLGTTT